RDRRLFLGDDRDAAVRRCDRRAFDVALDVVLNVVADERAANCPAPARSGDAAGAGANRGVIQRADRDGAARGHHGAITDVGGNGFADEIEREGATEGELVRTGATEGDGDQLRVK